MPYSAAHRPIAVISPAGYTTPDGFDGDTKNRALVCAVRAASSWSTVTRKPEATSVCNTTVVPPAKAMHSG